MKYLKLCKFNNFCSFLSRAYVCFLGMGMMFCFSSGVQAHPTSYEGGFSLMSEGNSLMQERSLIYSPKYWLGLGLANMRSPGQFNLVSSQLGLLVHRWNLKQAQGNFYVIGGLGHGQIEANGNLLEKNGMLYRFGAQADFETRRIYTFLRYVEHRFTEDNSLVSDQLSAAIGFAPYLAEFDELNSWVIFKIISSRQLDEIMYMPMLRFFYKNFLWEVGQDLDGNSQLNFMIRL